jgi:hypothetical protein
MAGIWAEKWASLDGTSWLYFVADQHSPFEVTSGYELDDCSAVERLTEQHDIDFQVFPTIFTDEITVINNSSDTPFYLDVFSFSGRLCFSEKEELSFGEARISVSGLPPGVYWMRIRTTRKSIFKKLIKIF